MNINVNRQFILLDFALIDDPRFLKFVSAAEFGTYLILRRFIWSYCQELCMEGSRGVLLHPESIVENDAVHDLRQVMRGP